MAQLASTESDEKALKKHVEEKLTSVSQEDGHSPSDTELIELHFSI